MSKEVIDRFESKVVKQEGCWKWTGQVGEDGYGVFHFDRHRHKAHRIAYQVYVGQIPDGLVLDHLCRNRSCCNPSHLEPVTIGENVKRGFKTMTHCKKGHSYEEHGVFIRSGRRRCKTCTRNGQRERYRTRYSPLVRRGLI